MYEDTLALLFVGDLCDVQRDRFTFSLFLKGKFKYDFWINTVVQFGCNSDHCNFFVDTEPRLLLRRM